MSEVTEQHIKEIKDKMEQSRIIYLKYAGALEVLESIVSAPKIEKKDKKVKK